LAVALAAFGVGYWVVFLQADNAYLMARVGSTGAERIEHAQRAVALNPFNDMYRAEVGLAYTDATIHYFNEAVNETQAGGDATASIRAAQTNFVAAERSIKETIEYVPTEYDNYVFLSNLYNMGGQFLGEQYYEQAAVVARQGIGVSEFGPAIRFQYARALYGMGDVEEAIEELTYAVSMDPAYSDAALLLSSYHEEQGDTETALRVLRETEAYRPGRDGVAEQIARLESALPTATP
jgi:tetratricopeptide (TPR) repeat protein